MACPGEDWGWRRDCGGRGAPDSLSSSPLRLSMAISCKLIHSLIHDGICYRLRGIHCWTTERRKLLFRWGWGFIRIACVTVVHPFASRCRRYVFLRRCLSITKGSSHLRISDLHRPHVRIGKYMRTLSLWLYDPSFVRHHSYVSDAFELRVGLHASCDGGAVANVPVGATNPGRRDGKFWSVVPSKCPMECVKKGRIASQVLCSGR